MIWVVIGAVTVAIVGLWIYLFVIRWRRMARHGRLEIPCDTEIALPRGEVVVYYEDRHRWRYSERPRPWDGFALLVSDAEDGTRVDLSDSPSDTAQKTGGKNRIPYATIRLPRESRYRVVAQVDAGATDPAVTFG
jgi:hypothetical protein